MKNTVLLCAPAYFDVEYSINPWMQGEFVNKSLAMQQWFEMKNILELLGVTVKLIDQKSGLPDMVFTANAGTIRNDHIVLSNFKHNVRKPETGEYEKWFKEAGYTTHRLLNNINFEGCGDTKVSGTKLLGGYGFRSDLKGLRQAAEILDLDYHLDTCFCLLREDLALYYPGAFSKYTISKIKDIELIPVSDEAAHDFACNSIVYKDSILMPLQNEETIALVEGLGFDVHPIDTSEFLKSGGSLKCMSLWV